METYGGFAGVYDRLMDDFDYEGWADYYLNILDRAGGPVSTMCECACGTGSMTLALSRRGVALTGVDISAEMLEIASQKARADGRRIAFVRQDMCRLELPRKVDAVIAACDGVNYLATLDRVRAFFSSARAALKPGGRIAFDISSRHKLEDVVARGVFCEERDDVAYLWANAYDRESRIVTMDLTFFIRTANGLYRKTRETHRQRAHGADEIERALSECGFSNISTYGDRTFDPPGAEEMRIHFSAVRD